jgi:hypothetical protein
MKKALTMTSLYLFSRALAASEERATSDVPVAAVDMMYVVIFLVLFIGSIVGFCIYFFFKKDDDQHDRE